jgi:tetratricopeptide (TPR) repeat protein
LPPRRAQTRKFTCLNLIAVVALGGTLCAGLLALSYVAFAFPAVRDSLAAFQHYNAALEYSQQRECDRAAAEFEAVVRLDSLGLYPDASQRLAGARVCQKENHYAGGVAAMNAADWQRAVDEFTIVVALDPDYRDAQAKLAEARRQLTSTPPTPTRPVDEGG